MAGFVKVYGTILDSSVWGESPATKVVWITLLAMADASGYVEAAIPGLARRACVSIAEVETALEIFMTPDTYSKDPSHEGRRVEKVDGGWTVLNHTKYREMRTDKQIADAERQRSHRVTRVRDNSGDSVTGRDMSQMSHEASVSVSVITGDTTGDSTDVIEGSSRDSVTTAIVGSITPIYTDYRGEGPRQTSLIPIEAEVTELARIEPPTGRTRVEALARLFLEARSLRLHGSGGRPPSIGMVRAISKQMDGRLKDGFDPEFLVSLPVLVDDQALDYMLKKDAGVLLRTDTPQGGKLHARRYEGQLPDVILSRRQVDILKTIGTWAWAVRNNLRVKSV